MAYLFEQAGGAATDGLNRILDVKPTEIHQRTPLHHRQRRDVMTYRQFMTGEPRQEGAATAFSSSSTLTPRARASTNAARRPACGRARVGLARVRTAAPTTAATSSVRGIERRHRRRALEAQRHQRLARRVSQLGGERAVDRRNTELASVRICAMVGCARPASQRSAVRCDVPSASPKRRWVMPRVMRPRTRRSPRGRLRNTAMVCLCMAVHAAREDVFAFDGAAVPSNGARLGRS